MTERKKVYFTCALGGLPIEHRERMIALRESLADEFEMLEFCDPKKVSDGEIFRTDIDVNVRIADFILAIADERATGLGYELGTAIEKHGIPTLACAHVSSRITPILTGNDRPIFHLFWYESVSEIKSRFIEFSKIDFPKPGKIIYLVMTVTTLFSGEPSLSIIRSVDSDPLRALGCARSMRGGQYMGDALKAIVIYEMREGEECGFDDFRLKQKEVWGASIGPDFRSGWNESFRGDFRELVDRLEKKKAPSA